MRLSFRLLFCSASLVLLAACGPEADIKESLGITHRPPDEFRVYSRPPLTVPPAFDLSPPGQESESSVAAAQASEQAREAVLGGSGGSSAPTGGLPPVTAASGAHMLDVERSQSTSAALVSVSSDEAPTHADAQFLNDIGAAQADPAIRKKIEQDTANGTAAKNSSYLIDPKSDDPVVNAKKEADRIKQDQQQNQPVTTGDTPTVTQSKGLLSNIF